LPKELRVFLLLEENGNKPVFEPQFPRAEGAAAEGIVLEFALAGQHGVAHASALGQGGVELLDKAAGRFHQHTVAHGHNGGHAPLKEIRGDRLGGVFRLGGLAGFEEHERDAVVAQDGAELFDVDGLVAASVQLADVLRQLEAESAQTDAAIVDTVPVEVDDVIGLLVAPSPVEFLAEGGQRRRAENVELHEAAEGLHGVDERQGAGAVVDIGAGVVFGPGRNEQDADGRCDGRGVEGTGAGQAPADACGVGTLEKEAVAVVEQFPGKAEQKRGGLASPCDVGIGRAGDERRIDVDGEATSGLAVDRGPDARHVGRVFRRQGGTVQQLAPLDEVLFHVARPVAEVVAWPDGVLLQIPTQLLGLDGADRSGEPPALVAVNVRPAGCGRFVDESRTGRGAADAFFLVEIEIAEFENQFFKRFGLGLRHGSNIGRKTLAQGHEDRVNRRFDATRIAGHGDVDRFLLEELFQDAELGAVQRKGDNRVLLFATLLLDLQRVAEFLADPFGLQRGRTNHNGVGRGVFDGLLDFGPQRIAAVEFAGVDPDVLLVVAELLLQLADLVVVDRAVREEHCSHGLPPSELVRSAPDNPVRDRCGSGHSSVRGGGGKLCRCFVEDEDRPTNCFPV
jgi:hypothetical protein